MALKSVLYVAFLIASLGTISVYASSPGSCVYTVYIRTGSFIKAGTDSNISLSLGDSKGEAVVIENLVAWGGLMGENYDYFERGNLDIFSGRGPCLDAPICSMSLVSDGTGAHHGWFCEHVQVTSTRPHLPCQQHLFHIDQWLATDAPPYDLTAFRDECPYVPMKQQQLTSSSSSM